MIKAPYNFVPLPDKVVFPDWGPLISQDVPFSDGISGTISLRLRAESPIFVRNGHTRKDAEEKSIEYSSFSNVDGKYFIPGTTVKGAIRSVLEILTFGKMRLDRNARFAQREWNNRPLYTIKGDQRIRCGWLKISDDGSCEITDCGRPYRIGHGRIDAYLKHEVFKNQFSEHNTQGLNDKRLIGEEEIDPKTAYYKYRLIESSLKKFRDIKFSRDNDYANDRQPRRLDVDPHGEIEGTIVLTGQPDQWKDPRPRRWVSDAGKYYEFVFPTPDSRANRYCLSEDEFNQYKFIYADSPDWNYMVERKPYGERGIPVFFRVQNDRLKDWGLSYMYRLPYVETPFSSLPEEHQEDRIDMAESIFGYIGKDASLKGRVQFSHFMSEVRAEVTGNPDDDVPLILASPKASYYPAYVSQEGSSGHLSGAYKTYNDGTINGWKRYLRRTDTYGRITRRPDEDHAASESMVTIIRPVSDVVFDGTVRFHNLRPEEVGALLSALTFHDNQDTCRHLIGMGKPYGYGKMALEITGTEFHSVGTVTEDKDLLDRKGYMEVFEFFMNKSIPNWIGTPTVKELLTLSKVDVPANDYTYMTLGINGINEFEDEKIRRSYLQKFSEIINSTETFDSLLDSHRCDISELTKQREEHQQKIEKKKENLEREEREKAYEQRLLKKKEDEAQAKRKEAEADEVVRRMEEQNQKKAAATKAAKRSAGLSFLEEKYDSGKYKVYNFKEVRKRVNDYLKKIFEASILPEDQWQYLYTALVRVSATTNDKEKEAFSVRDSNVWKYVEKITSKEFADSVFAEVNP
ncbi:MAG: TIGR03986 family CRISPR-associated RAMP protein [Muribaculaceae bacterium]|nr:TIGR03986 family CRISPR-associated RAMP protein [Muribaculaceae bacterium]